jgi:hypothetical protein
MADCPMKQGLQLDFEWLASGPVDSPARVGLAALSIWVNDKPAANARSTSWPQIQSLLRERWQEHRAL